MKKRALFGLLMLSAAGALALSFDEGGGSSPINPFAAVRGLFTNTGNTSGLVVSNKQSTGAHGIPAVGAAISGEGTMRLLNASLPAAAGSVADIVFQLLNTAGTTKVFGVLGIETTDVTPGSEDAQFFIDLIVNGLNSSTHALEVTDTELILDRVSAIRFPTGATISIPSGAIAWKLPSSNPASGQTAFLKVDNNGQMTITEAQPSVRTKAQLNALAPSAAGLIYYCSDCATDLIVASTGTATGAFGRVSARTTAIN